MNEWEVGSDVAVMEVSRRTPQFKRATSASAPQIRVRCSKRPADLSIYSLL